MQGLQLLTCNCDASSRTCYLQKMSSHSRRHRWFHLFLVIDGFNHIHVTSAGMGSETFLHVQLQPQSRAANTRSAALECPKLIACYYCWEKKMSRLTCRSIYIL